MVGSAVVRLLHRRGFRKLLLPSRNELDLSRQAETEHYFRENRPQVVVFAAARVGGIHANSTAPAEFIYDNLTLSINCIHAAWMSGTQRFLFLGSTCIYPRMAPQPISEDAILTSELEPTNEAYAIAKIAGVKMCEYYRRQYGVLFHSAMPTNLYGPGDNYHHEKSHVLPGLIRRFHEARESGADSVTIWGSGNPLREFLHVDDLASAVVHLLELADPPDIINVGSGEEVSIRNLAEVVATAVGFAGSIKLDASKPDGTPRKFSDTTLIRRTGWAPRIRLSDGIRMAYESFCCELRAGTLRCT